MKNQILIILAVLVLLLGCSYSKQSELVQLKLNIGSSAGDSTPTEAKPGVPLPLVEVGVSRLDKIENMDANTIMPGKYFGESYNLTSSFIPVLTIDNKHEFILEWGIQATTRGTYTVDSNKLILNTIGGERYILEITEHSLKNTQDMPNIRSNTNFRLSESDKEKVTSQSL